MEGNFRAGDTHLKLLDLIPNGGGCKEMGGESFRFAEQKLELRLAPPGGEDWAEMEQTVDRSIFSQGTPSRVSTRPANASAGAKRGFSDALESSMQGFVKQQQKYSFLISKAGGMDAEEQQEAHENRDGKAYSPPSASTPSSRNAAAAPSSSQARTAAAPVVGWPPIRSFRKNLTSCSAKPPSPPQKGCHAKAEKQEVPLKGKFVKINMDGVPIGRKVDLNFYNSYEKLSSSVDQLFEGLLAAQRKIPASENQNDGDAAPRPAITGLLDGSGEHTLVYEDEEGDKLLVGDVPWEMFVSSVKRLRVLKSSDLSTLSLAAASRKRAAPDSHVQ